MRDRLITGTNTTRVTGHSSTQDSSLTAYWKQRIGCQIWSLISTDLFLNNTKCAQVKVPYTLPVGKHMLFTPQHPFPTLPRLPLSQTLPEYRGKTVITVVLSLVLLLSKSFLLWKSGELGSFPCMGRVYPKLSEPLRLVIDSLSVHAWFPSIPIPLKCQI